MHPLSLFPTLLSWGRLAPLLLRLSLGAVLVFWAYRTFKNSAAPAKDKAIGIIEFISGILLVIGLWTQAAALVAIVDLAIRLFERITKKAFLTDGVNYYLILLAIAISLILTGPGLGAFDLPL